MVGSSHYAYLYLLKNEPFDSFSVLAPSRATFGGFSNNSAHIAGLRALKVYPYLESKTVPVIFDGFTAYETPKAIELVETKNAQVRDARLFNTQTAIEINYSFYNGMGVSSYEFYNEKNGSVVTDCVIVADFGLANSINQPRIGINLPCDRGLLLNNVTFADFGDNSYAISKTG